MQRLKRERVWHMAQLIAGGEWPPKPASEYRRQSRSLAAAWGVKPVTVRAYAAEASRLVDWTTSDRARLAELVKVKLRQWVEEGKQDRVQAARTLLENLGELRQNLTVSTPDPFEDWTENEARHYAETGERPKRLMGGGDAASR